MLVKLMKNRFFLLVISIVISVLIAFIIIPAVISKSLGTVDVVRVNRTIQPNTKIEREYLSVEKVGKVNLPESIIKSPDDIVGKYSKVELLPGDNLVNEKFNNFNDIENNFLYLLKGDNKVAVSISVKSFAAGVSGMIEPGDIVSIMSYSNSISETEVDSEAANKTDVVADTRLQNLEVASINKNTDNSGDFGTITVLCSREQALLLIEAENSGNIHFVFSRRGDKTNLSKIGGAD